MPRSRASLRTRLAASFGAALALILLAFAAGIYGFTQHSLNQQLNAELTHGLDAVETIINSSDEPREELNELEEQGVLTFVRVDADGRPYFRSTSWKRLDLDQLDVKDGRVRRVDIGGKPHVLASRMIVVKGLHYDATAAVNGSFVPHALHQLLRVLGAGFLVVTLLALAGGYWLAGRLLRPVAMMAERARHISAERLSERLPIENPDDELGRMAAAFNESLARLEDSFDRLRRFTADASHELRTPLTVMRSVGEVALREAHDPVAAREAIGSMLEEVQRLTRLIESLLFFARADAGTDRPQPESIEVERLANEVVEHMRPLAEEKSQRIAFDCQGSEWVLADRVSLRQALINLLDNAIKYSATGAAIRVSVHSGADEMVVISVADQGVGIPQAEHERIFERFYRLDPARAREPGVSGGVGLGLAIARRAVEANLGRIDLTSAVGKGSTFRIWLPRA